MISFIGAGNMASAIVRGMVDSGFEAGDITVTSPDDTAATLASDVGCDEAPDNTSAVDSASYGGTVVLAVKPHVIADVAEEIRAAAAEYGSVIVSIAAGISLETLASHFEPGQPIVRVMPNVAAQVRQAMSGICATDSVSEEQVAGVEKIFETVGQVARIPESQFAVYAALAGCSPAFVFDWIEAMARAGVAGGISKPEAVRIVAQALAGSAQLALDAHERGITPTQLADQVSSPGGTTIAGRRALTEAGFEAAVGAGVDAAVARDREIAAG